MKCGKIYMKHTDKNLDSTTKCSRCNKKVINTEIFISVLERNAVYCKDCFDDEAAYMEEYE